MKIKILHVIKTLELGGAETNLRNLVQAFDHQAFEHHVAYSFGGEIEVFFLDYPQVRLFQFAHQKHNNSSIYSIGIVFRLWRYILKNKINIVHTHNFNGHFWGVFAAKLAGARVIEHVHDFRYYDPQELRRRYGDFNLNRFIGFFKGLSDFVVVLTRQNRDFLVNSRFYPSPRVRIVPNGIPLPSEIGSTKKNLARELGFSENAPVIFTCCRISKTKNIGLILKIAQEVTHRVPGVVFLIAGDGPMLQECRDLTAHEGLEKNIRFLGFHVDLGIFFRAADIFLLPSFLELHSIAILEAMSFGVPVVVSAGVGCNSDVLTDGVDSVLLDPFTEKGWADAIEALLRGEDRRMAMGRKGRELCGEQFNIKLNAGQIEGIYRELSS